MVKIDIEIINKYINGEIIDEELLEELEDNSDFMKSVIFLSNDKKMYNLCSNNVKKDYKFVLYIINKFQDDEEFICSVADYFLNNCENKVQYFEFAIIMSDLLNDSDYSVKYDSIVKQKYYGFKKSRDIYIANNPGKESFAGVGFIYVDYSYSGSRIVKDYCAKKFIDELINNKEFEKYIHEKYNSYGEFNDNVNNEIVNYVNIHDSVLANYIVLGISILDSVKISLQNIKKNWNKYDKIQENKRYYYMFNLIQYYMMEHDNGKIGEYLMIHYVSRKMGILDKVVKYTKFDYSEVVKQLDKIDLDSIIETSIPDRINYYNCIEIIDNTIFKGNLDYDYHQNSEKSENCKIIKFNKQGN